MISPGRLAGPWFQRRPRLAVAAALASIAAVTLLRFAVGDEADATVLLFALPVSLVALAFGFRAGLASSAICLLILLSWVVAAGVSLTVLGWVSRVVPLLLLGTLIGHASDAQREAARIAHRLLVAEERERDAAEINDTIVQHLSAAKWMLERGAVDDGIAEVDEAIRAGQDLVRELLDGRSDARVVRPLKAPLLAASRSAPTNGAR